MVTRSKRFLQGLPFTLRTKLFTLQTKLFYRHDLDLKGDDAINFDDLLEKALTLIGAKKQMIDLAHTHYTSEKISDWVDKFRSKAHVFLLSDYAFLFFESAVPPLVLSVGISFPGFFIKKSDEKIDNLTDKMRSLTLST